MPPGLMSMDSDRSLMAVPDAWEVPNKSMASEEREFEIVKPINRASIKILKTPKSTEGEDFG
jgi:hypothetical protein